VFVPRAALAQTEQGSKDEARRFFKAGQKAFLDGQYEQAARAFEEAFRIQPHPAPLINAGDAYEKAGQLGRAARTFERVKALDNSTEQDRQDATDRLAKLTPKLGTLLLDGAPTTLVRVDGQEFAAGQRIYVDPGQHEVTLDVDGAKLKTVEVAAGASRTVDVVRLMPMTDIPDTPPPTTGDEPDMDRPPTKQGGVRAPTWIAFGVAAVGVGGAVYFGLEVNDAEKSFDDDPNQEDFDRFNDNKLYTNISIGVAAVGAGVGTILLITDLNREVPTAGQQRGPRLTGVGLTPLTGGGLLSGAGRF
jgi:tetratricopeptide (TPR) repeat protein